MSRINSCALNPRERERGEGEKERERRETGKEKGRKSRRGKRDREGERREGERGGEREKEQGRKERKRGRGEREREGEDDDGKRGKGEREGKTVILLYKQYLDVQRMCTACTEWELYVIIGIVTWLINTTT